jgi:hypothetical protein
LQAFYKIKKRGATMEKMVIFKEFNEYKTTNESNYNNYIIDCLKVKTWAGFNDAAAIIDYCVKYLGKNENDFIIIYD